MSGLRQGGKAGRVEAVEVVVELFDELVELVEAAAVKLVREQMLTRARNAWRLVGKEVILRQVAHFSNWVLQPGVKIQTCSEVIVSCLLSDGNSNHESAKCKILSSQIAKSLQERWCVVQLVCPQQNAKLIQFPRVIPGKVPDFFFRQNHKQWPACQINQVYLTVS